MLDIATLDSHWEYWQAKVLVAYQPYDNATDTALPEQEITDIEALTEEITKEDYEYGQSQGVHTQLKNWCLRLSMLQGVAVTKNGRIVDADEKVWVVMKSIKRSFNTRWKCICYALEG